MTTNANLRGLRQGSLDCLFDPRTVAVVGALDDGSRAGGRLVKYLTDYGYEGTTYFVNPTRGSVGGQSCYPSVSDLPEKVDVVLLSVSARRAPAALRDAGQAGAGAAVVFATGFAEAGAVGVSLQDEIAEVADSYPTRVLGPNTAGVRSAAIRFFGEQGTNLSTVGYRLGSVAVVSQSGALGGYFGSTYLSRLGVGTRYFVDTGNEVDIDAADCIHYLADDPAVSSIAVMLESCRDGRKLASAVARATASGTPVVLLKVGRTRAGMEAARSHTAALASGTEVFAAELRAAGAVVVEDELQLVDSLALFASGQRLNGSRVGIVTPSGGFGVLALDVASEQGVEIPPVEPFAEPGQVGLGGMSNPLELAGLATSGTELLDAALKHMGSQPNLDGVILWHPHRLLRPDQQEPHLQALAGSQQATGKPHFHCGLVTDEFRIRLLESGVISIETPTRLMRAIAAAAAPSTSPPAITTTSSSPLDMNRPTAVDRSAHEVREWLNGIGIEVVATHNVSSAKAGMRRQEEWGVPVMVKIESDLATHKTERGLVMGPVAGSGLREAIDSALSHPILENDPAAQVVIQPFERGVELAIGAYHDPVFGPTVMVAHGGIFTEVIKDAAFAAAPVTPDRAEVMLRQLRFYPALAGHRGHPADISAVVAAIVALSDAVAAVDPEFSLDINPLIVRGAEHGVVAVDARIVSAPAGSGK